MIKMKDSGIPWVGLIPEHWNITKANYQLKKMERPIDDTMEVVTCFRDGMVTLRKNRRLDGFTESFKEIGYQGIEVGDLVIHEMDAFAGAVGISDSRGKATPVYSVCTLKNAGNIKYYAHLIKIMSWTGLIQSYAQGIRVRSVDFRFKTLKKQNIPVPPVKEQEIITEYLDLECKKIDEIKSDITNQIDILLNYKNAIITEIISQGLNKNCYKKDSNITWIGKIPKHWEINKIKYTSTLKGRIGWQGLTSDEYQNEGPYLITGTDFMNGSINWDSCVRITENRYEEAKNIQIKNNDLLITKDGTVGKVAIVENLNTKASLNSGVLLIRPQFDYCVKYLFYVLNSNIFWHWFNLKNAGNSTIIHLYQGDFKEFKYPLPPLVEQQKIAEHLDTKCKEIDSIINAKHKQLQLIDNYKKSLIFEIVTGKKEIIHENINR